MNNLVSPETYIRKEDKTCTQKNLYYKKTKIFGDSSILTHVLKNSEH